MNVRLVLVAVVVPLIVLLESVSWYGLRSVQFVYTMDALGVGTGTIGMAVTMSSVIRAVALVAGGVAAALLGPFVTASVALGAFAIAVTAVGFVPTDQPGLALGLIAVATFANGAAVAPLWAGLAAALARPLQAGRDAAFFVTYAAVQIGGLMASALWAFTDAAGFGHNEYAVLFGACGALALVAALLAAALAGAHVALPPVPEDDASERFDGRAAGVAALVGVLSLLPWLGYGILSDQSWSASWQSGATPAWALSAVNPILVLLMTIGFALASAVAGWFRLDLPVLLLAGVAFLVSAIGGAAAAGASGFTAWGPMLAVVVLSGTEGLMLPLLLSRIVGDVHWRLSCLLAGLWLGVGNGATVLASAATSAVAASVGYTPPMLVGAALCGLGGLVLLAVAVPHQRVMRALLDPPVPETSPRD